MILCCSNYEDTAETPRLLPWLHFGSFADISKDVAFYYSLYLLQIFADIATRGLCVTRQNLSGLFLPIEMPIFSSALASFFSGLN